MIPQNLPLSRKYISRRFSDEDLFKYYFGDFEVNKMYSSPFRKDPTPSFNIFYTPGGELLYKDFGQSNVVGDVVSFISKLYGLSYRDSLAKIYSDLILNKPSNQSKVKIDVPKIIKAPANLEIKTKEFTEESFQYWKDHKVRKETLKRYLTTDVEYAKLEGDLIFVSVNNYHAYCFYEPISNKNKIYRPFNSKSKKQRFLSNYNYNSLFGLSQLPEKGEVLFWTKACKDVLIFSELGYNAICPAGETYLLSGFDQKIITDIRERFKTIIVCYDNDLPGIEASKLYLPYFDKAVFVPKESLCKDVGEFSFRNPIEETNKLITSWLH